MKSSENQRSYLRAAINAIKAEYGLSTQKDILREMHYSSPSYISDFLNGTRSITRHFLNRLEETFGVNPRYVLNGERPIFNGNTSKEEGKRESTKNFLNNVFPAREDTIQNGGTTETGGTDCKTPINEKQPNVHSTKQPTEEDLDLLILPDFNSILPPSAGSSNTNGQSTGFCVEWKKFPPEAIIQLIEFYGSVITKLQSQLHDMEIENAQFKEANKKITEIMKHYDLIRD